MKKLWQRSVKLNVKATKMRIYVCVCVCLTVECTYLSPQNVCTSLFAPGIGHNIAMHAKPTARKFFLSNFYLSDPLNFISSNPFPSAFSPDVILCGWLGSGHQPTSHDEGTGKSVARKQTDLTCRVLESSSVVCTSSGSPSRGGDVAVCVGFLLLLLFFHVNQPSLPIF